MAKSLIPHCTHCDAECDFSPTRGWHCPVECAGSTRAKEEAAREHASRMRALGWADSGLLDVDSSGHIINCSA